MIDRAVKWKEQGTGVQAFSATLRSATDLQIQQLDPTQTFNWFLNCAHFETSQLKHALKLSIWTVAVSADWSCVANNPDDDIIMTFPLSGQLVYRFTDQTITIEVGQAIIYKYSEEIGREFYALGNECVSVSLKLSQLKARRIIARRTGRLDGGRTDFRQVIDETQPGFVFVRELVITLSDPTISATLSSVAEDTRYSLITTVGQLVFDVMPNSVWKPERLGEGAPPYVRRACQYVLDHYKNPITVREMAEFSAVSIRKLERGFSEGMGMTPTAYIKNVRLEAIHAALMARNFKGSVSAFAASCGYSSRHRFRNDYVLKYGETPKETLASSRV